VLAPVYHLEQRQATKHATRAAGGA
jgi:hypothetical protein